MSAVIQNEYTGNGSTTTYSFTFPYLKTSDIKASLDGVATTAFTLPNATTLQFNTAPTNGAKIKIFRETGVDNLTATFYAGSAIKSEDLNDNFTQNLYKTQEVGARAISNLGGTMTGDLSFGTQAQIVFEGATDDAHETTLAVTDPTADRTITLPNVTGTVVTTGDTGTVTNTMIANQTITGAKIQDLSISTAEIANGNITNVKLAAAGVTTDKISDSNVTTAKLANDAVTAAKLADNAVVTANIVDANVTTAKIAADAITNAKIADNSIDSEHYVDGSIDAAHLASNSVTNAKMADDSVGTAELQDSSVDTARLADNSVTLAKMTDNSVGTAELVDSSATTAKIADSNVTEAKIANNAVTTVKIANNAVTNQKVASGAISSATIIDANVTTAKIADSAVTTSKIAGTAVTDVKLASNAVTTSKITDANVTTDKIANDAITIGKIGCEQTTISDSDSHIPTSGAVVDYVAAQLAPIGGLEVIATEVAFPNTQPAAGVVISIADAGGIVVNGSGTSTTGRTVGGSTVTINNINSAFNSSTVDAGVSFMVSSTGSGQVYNFHKATLKESDIINLSNDINDFGNRYRVFAGEPSSNNDEGDLVYDTNANKMKVYDTSTSAWKEVTSSGDFKYIFLCPAGGSGAPTINGSIATYDLREGSNTGSAASVTSAAQLIVSINGVVQKANTGTSAPAEGFALVDSNTIVFGANLQTGDSVFIVQIGSAITISTPGDGTVSEAKIASGAVTQAKIADQAVNEAKLQVSNSPVNGYFLSAQSGNTGGLTWAQVDTGVTSDAHGNTVAGTNAGNSFSGTDAASNT
ncbi:phage tail fiber protein, partial [Marinobacter sp.]|uniref:beta strand repeat-containing protein n=1 Tax=Marinobacter sp. TaxID=50741 RepID=UPI000C939A51